MAHEVLMPKLSSTMDVGTITTWLKEEGDAVNTGDAIFEVMTDKIAIEVEAYETGILLKKYLKDGDSAPVNAIIAYIGEADEKVPDEMPGFNLDLEKESDTQPPTKENTPFDPGSEEVTIAFENIRATPAARKAAREKEINLATMKGSGPKGRIQLGDVNKYKIPIDSKQIDLAGEKELIPWKGMRKVIADKMLESKTTIPHVTMHAEVNMTKIKALRQKLLPLVEEETGQRISLLEIIMKATMVALQAYPELNAYGLKAGIKRFEAVHLGVAVAVSEGLVVPVIKNADAMGLSKLTKVAKTAIRKARDNELLPEEMSGGTFTISSLGKSRVQTFTPIINVPESAILGVGGMYDKPSINDTGELENISACNLSLSFDHRVVDGAPAAAFLSKLVDLLENPIHLLL